LTWMRPHLSKKTGPAESLSPAPVLFIHRSALRPRGSAHVTHASAAAGHDRGAAPGLRLLGDHGLGGQQQAGDGAGVLQRGACDLGGVGSRGACSKGIVLVDVR
jgi:hypothetical protein